MDCTGILLALQLCTPAAEPAPLALTDEKPAACLTKSQARAIYKTAHLYWHTANHCWDDQPTRTRKYQDTSHRAAVPKRSRNPEAISDARAQALPVDPTGNATSYRTRQEVFYPGLVAQQAEIAADIYTVQKPITQWPLMLDIDATGPRAEPACIEDNGICWLTVEALHDARG